MAKGLDVPISDRREDDGDGALPSCAALDNQPSGVPWLLVLCLLSMLAWAGYALAGSYFL